jgi:hypothetical protein
MAVTQSTKRVNLQVDIPPGSSALKTEAVYCREAFVSSYKFARSCNPENQHRHFYRRENCNLRSFYALNRMQLPSDRADRFVGLLATIVTTGRKEPETSNFSPQFNYILPQKALQMQSTHA